MILQKLSNVVSKRVAFTHPSLEVDTGAPVETQSTSQKKALLYLLHPLLKPVYSFVIPLRAFNAYLLLSVLTSQRIYF